MNDEIQVILVSAARTLALIPLEELELYVEENYTHLSEWGTMAPMRDPTAYRNAIQSGAHEDATHQLEIAKRLLEVRRAIESRENSVKRRNAS